MATIKVKKNNEWQSVAIANAKTEIIEVPIEPVVEALEITENGTYAAPEGVDGYNPITVNVPTGGGGDIEVEPIVLTGMQNYGCAGPMAGTYMKLFGDTISTQDITSANYMFYSNPVEHILFDINIDKNSYLTTMNHMFDSCVNLKELPYIYNAMPDGLESAFASCTSIREIPEDYFDTWDFEKRMHIYQYASMNTMFGRCYSLRRVPSKILKQLYTIGSSYYQALYSLFYSCYALDEVVDMACTPEDAQVTSNMLDGTVSSCARLKRFTFETNPDGTPKVVKWRGQTFDLSYSVGYMASSSSLLLDYNSGITADKEVKDDATYQALKDDPDWFSCKVAYSRYNHDSAVETINSLPDTFAFSSTGGTNIIKFRGACGSSTDGGAINTLTEAEIAVAAAKGWSVTYI